MAIAALSPTPHAGPIEDSVTIKEASALFAETGYPVAESTLRDWAQRAGLRSVRGRYSDSELLELHRVHIFGT